MNYLLEQAWIQALGWTLLHATWQACLVAASWALVRKFLGNASAKQRYLLAISALPVLVLCAVITFWKVYPETISNPMGAVTLDAIDFSTFEGLSLSNLDAVASEKSWQDILHVLAPWLSIIWILGAVVMGIRLTTGLWYLKSLRREGLHALSTSWQARAENIAQNMGISTKWKIWESELVSEPLTLGHFKPIILIPAGMLSGLSPDQVEAIIAHEFAHIYRADFLFNLIQSLIEILFFFHPAVWWLSREIRRERELCCDDLAVATLGDAFIYAEALTRLQSFCHSPKHFLTMQAKGNSGSFTARIHRLFIPVNSRPSIWKSLSAAMLLMIGIVGTGYYAYTQSREFVRNPSPAIVETSTDLETGLEKNTLSEENADPNSHHQYLAYLPYEPEENLSRKFFISPDLSDKEFSKIRKKLAKYDLEKSPSITRNEEGKIVDFFFLSEKNDTYSKLGIRNFSYLEIEISRDEAGKPKIGMKDPTGNPYYTREDKQEQTEIEAPVQELPTLVYLDGQSIGFYEGGVNEVFPQLIQKGIIQAHEDIGKVSFYAIENGDMYPFFLGEELPPPPPVSKPEPHHKKFNIYVLNSWEYLAKKFDQEGKEKHRLYIVNGNTVGFRKGEVGDVLEDLLKQNNKGLEKSTLKAIKINAKETYEKYKVRAVEVVEIAFTEGQDSKGPADCQNCKEEIEQGPALENSKNWKFETEKGNYEVKGDIVYSDIREEGGETQNFFLFDGKPIGYFSGDIFEVVAQELGKRNLTEVGGIVICDADKSDADAGKVVQILSEEYEPGYYQRIKEDNNQVVNIEDLDPGTKVILDEQVVPVEILQQIDPNIIASIKIIGGETQKTQSTETESGPLVVVRTKVNIGKVDVKTSFDFDKKVELSPSMDLNLTVSPNPSPGTFNIDFELDRELALSFSVRDLQGKLIYKEQPKAYGPGSQKIIWEADQQANGVYILQLETDEGIISSKRIILKK